MLVSNHQSSENWLGTLLKVPQLLKVFIFKLSAVGLPAVACVLAVDGDPAVADVHVVMAALLLPMSMLLQVFFLLLASWYWILCNMMLQYDVLAVACSSLGRSPCHKIFHSLEGGTSKYRKSLPVTAAILFTSPMQEKYVQN
jgi:hypothetical protein